ncbi:hypothetical protein [uncultured Amaricoccus sp.]|uniref:hypothetical protein n=1 Tax=uncultured Amaricoccus sp. TaxID=339341 RepID=UPI002605682A|nr:hypothetical protein [uncultured Amaricoccus sp.]
MRSLFLALSLAAGSAGATAAEITRVEDCAPAIAADPAAAREQASVWYRLGGGTAARLCEASALEAMGADATAAQLLTGLAQNTNRVMSVPLRVSIIEDAGRLWLAAGRADLARETLASADRLSPPSAARLILRARAEAAEDDWTAAEASLSAALAEEPDNARARALRAATLRQLGDPAAALAEANRARAEDPDLPEAMFEAAAALAETGDTEAASQLWLDLIETHGDGDLAVLARRNLGAIN